MADWSMLPCDVLCEIALKLDEIEAFIYFSAVCHSWNHASSLVKSQWKKTNATIMPWMLLAEPENTNVDNPVDCVRKVYNLSNSKTYQLKLPETFGARCFGSPYGWLVVQNYNCMFEVHLFNPFTKVRITTLPSLLTLAHTPNDPLRDPQWYFHYFALRFVVLKLPHNDGDDDADLLIALIYGEFEYLAVARPGDKSWTDIDVVMVLDVICWGDFIYIVNGIGGVSYCDIRRLLGVGGGGDHLNKDVEVLPYVPACRQGRDNFDKVTLLDLCGNLLMVTREKVSNKYFEYATVAFQVYKLDIKINKWVIIQDIGNFAMFVGNNSSMVVPISKAKNLMKNCIYFTDDEVFHFEITPGYGGKDMGVYNMESGDITQFYDGDDTRSSFCPPMLFVPRMKL